MMVVIGGLSATSLRAPTGSPRGRASRRSRDDAANSRRSDPHGGGERPRQRVGDNWRLVEPDAADADAGVVGTVTSNLASLEVQRVVDENPTDLAQYGLNPARIEVAFRLKDQKDFQRLLVGEKTPTGGDVYAKRPEENRVFLVSSFLDAIFNKTPFDLRDKAVLKFERDKADGIEVVDARRPSICEKRNRWRIGNLPRPGRIMPPSKG